MFKSILAVLFALVSFDAFAETRCSTDGYGNVTCRDTYGNVVPSRRAPVDLSRIGLDGIKAAQDTHDAIEARKLSALIREEKELDILLKRKALEGADAETSGTVYRDDQGNTITCRKDGQGSLTCR